MPLNLFKLRLRIYGTENHTRGRGTGIATDYLFVG